MQGVYDWRWRNCSTIVPSDDTLPSFPLVSSVASVSAANVQSKVVQWSGHWVVNIIMPMTTLDWQLCLWQQMTAMTMTAVTMTAVTMTMTADDGWGDQYWDWRHIWVRGEGTRDVETNIWPNMPTAEAVCWLILVIDIHDLKTFTRLWP